MKEGRKKEGKKGSTKEKRKNIYISTLPISSSSSQRITMAPSLTIVGRIPRATLHGGGVGIIFRFTAETHLLLLCVTLLVSLFPDSHFPLVVYLLGSIL